MRGLAFIAVISVAVTATATAIAIAAEPVVVPVPVAATFAVADPPTAAVAVPTPESPTWHRHVEPPEFVLPRDHGAHFDTATEWWYLTANLEDDLGRSLGVQFTIFRAGLDPAAPTAGDAVLRVRHAIAAHLAVARPDEDAFASADRLRRLGDGLAWASEDDLDVGIEGWTLRRDADGTLHVQALAVENDMAVDLVFTPEKPVVVHGRGGLSQKGPEPGNASLYLSWTRLRIEGAITVDGERRLVRGAGWFDHEWGSAQLGEGVAGWDWFSLRLTDGRDLMVYRLRRDDGSADPFSSGTLVSPDGTTTPLVFEDITLEPTGQRWTSPVTGGTYPTAWHITVPAHGLDLMVGTQIHSAEVDGRRTTGVAYYESPVTVTGTASGEGYMELTGYAGTLEGRF